MSLRTYQQKLVNDVEFKWAQGYRGVLLRLDTGGGKTQIFCDILKRHVGAARVIVHRQELVTQVSLNLARQGVTHSLICAESTKHEVIRAHVLQFGQSFMRPGCDIAVVSVDTALRRIDPQAASVTLCVVDEAHHVRADNKWGKSLNAYPNAKLLLPTATPQRADGKGLGSHCGGLADIMVYGPPMRELIAGRYLVPARIFCPPGSIDMAVAVTASGDWSPAALAMASRKSTITGDAVSHYLRFAAGMKAICFVTDVQTAGKVAQAFNARGIAAAVLTGDTKLAARNAIKRGVETGDIRVIVAVDVVSEGYDLPELQAAVLARPSASLCVVMQQVGRALRPAMGKQHAVVIDMVGNIVRNGGPPDVPRMWTLDGAVKKVTKPRSTIRSCLGCFQIFEAFLKHCPHCDYLDPPPVARTIEAVMGELQELPRPDIEAFNLALNRIDAGPIALAKRIAARRVPTIGQGRVKRLHAKNAMAQSKLRQAMRAWALRQNAALTVSDLQRLFYTTFGIDVASAVVLTALKADALYKAIDSCANSY